jgi:MerR family redox-sensitive transcriptional activator SoxR
MRISEIAERTGIRATAIRYYEKIGLLPPPHRLNGRRVYDPDVLDRLTVIRFGLKTGFSLKELRSLFAGFASRSTRRKLAQGKLQELAALRAQLQTMEKLLREVRLCRCGTVSACVERLQKSGALNVRLTRLAYQAIPRER